MTICSISSWAGSKSGSGALYLTQVPQLLLRLLGTGIVRASSPFDLHRRSYLIDPKCIKKVAIYVFIETIIAYKRGNVPPLYI